MPEEQSNRFIQNIISFLKFLSKSTRIKIIGSLMERAKTRDEIKNETKLGRDKLLQELQTLREIKIIEEIRRKNKIYYSIENKKIFPLIELLNAYCAQLDSEQLKILNNSDVLDTLF